MTDGEGRKELLRERGSTIVSEVPGSSGGSWLFRYTRAPMTTVWIFFNLNLALLKIQVRRSGRSAQADGEKRLIHVRFFTGMLFNIQP